MSFPQRHRWDVTPEEAVAIQQQLRQEVITEDRLGPVRTIAGIDVGFEEEGTITRAAVVLLNFPGLELQESVVVRRPTTFPYVPGLLSFRETPAVLEAMANLKSRPDLIVCDGQGMAHPRRFGIACHIGLLSDLPAIGVAKTLLVGRHEPVPEEKGSWRSLQHRGEVVGAAVRTRANVKPVFVSPGHRISLETAIDYLMQCTTRYRLPEPTRQAHRRASEKNDTGDWVQGTLF